MRSRNLLSVFSHETKIIGGAGTSPVTTMVEGPSGAKWGEVLQPDRNPLSLVAAIARHSGKPLAFARRACSARMAASSASTFFFSSSVNTAAVRGGGIS